MKEVFEKIKKRIEEKREYYYLNDDVFDTIAVEALDFACDVIDEEVKNCNDGWILCSSGQMPIERDSIFASYKGIRKWNNAMFEKISDEVNVTVVDKNGNGTTTHAHTVDGKWSCDLLKCNKTYKVIAWQPLPEPYQPKICINTDCCYNQNAECPASEGCPGFERKTTNADVIRSMSDEELAEYIPAILGNCCNPNEECAEVVINHGECEKTKECALKWLKSESEIG